MPAIEPVAFADGRVRCAWVPPGDALYLAYHDEEWGVPLHDDQRLFEMLVLEGAQAGLSWSTILRKRENYRAACDGFDIETVAGYGPDRIDQLLTNAGLIRNRRKMEAMVMNARGAIALQEEFGSLSQALWQFVEGHGVAPGKPIRNAWRSLGEIPATSPQSEAMSKFLLQRGFKFVGPTICYAFMQAVGMVNDHTVDCFRYDQV